MRTRSNFALPDFPHAWQRRGKQWQKKVRGVIFPRPVDVADGVKMIGMIAMTEQPAPRRSGGEHA
jgi:hypothetical protein